MKKILGWSGFAVALVAVFMIGMWLFSLWFTWGNPLAMGGAKETAEEYLNAKYERPMMAVGAVRFLRGNYLVTACPVDDEELLFTLYVAQDLSGCGGERYLQAKFEREIAQSLARRLSNDPALSISAHMDISAFAQTEPEEEADLQDIQPLIKNKFYYAVEGINVDEETYLNEMNRMYEIIQAVKLEELSPSDITFYPNDFDFDAYWKGGEPRLRISIDKYQYPNINSPDDLVPYLEEAILANPFYS